HAAELAPLFERHLASALELAHKLGKRITIDLALADVRVEPRVAEAVDIAVLHLIRNAIDHGIELPEARRRAGKPEQGVVRVTVAQRDAGVEISVSDDGRGVDFAAIRELALAKHLIDPARASDEDALLELVYAPGFSTKSNVTETSGRGVGLDA